MPGASSNYMILQGIAQPSPTSVQSLYFYVPAAPAGTTVFLIETVSATISYFPTTFDPLPARFRLDVNGNPFDLLATLTTESLYVCTVCVCIPALPGQSVQMTVIQPQPHGQINGISGSMTVSGHFL